ncbi:MAG: Cna B-type domain-containing protein, partial [Erysipelotrichaceae bacterium]|nr:Cna B-type domain-containing protein [Erysipelotrichaceae bacterium]
GLTFFYTTDESCKDTTAAEWKNKKLTDYAIWNTAAIQSDGTVTLPEDLTTGENQITAWAIYGNLKSSKMTKADVSVTPYNALPNDRFVNQISMLDSVNSATAYIVSRQIAGVVWIDANKDGKRKETEARVPDVAVRLVTQKDYKENGSKAKTVKNLMDQLCETTTGEAGQYKFIDLPEGEYVVLFSDPNEVLTYYRATATKKEGVSDTVNSDATEIVNKKEILTGGVIEHIELPDVESIIVSPYTADNLDMGIVPLTVDITVEKVWRDGGKTTHDDVTVHLYADGRNTGKTVTLNDDNNWKGTFKNLNQYNDGTAIEYTIEEEETEGYISKITNKVVNQEEDPNQFIVTNYETINIEGDKEWDDNDNQDGKRPASITVNLVVKGKITDTRKLTDPNWHFEFTDLPKYDDNNKVIAYQISETLDTTTEKYYTGEVTGNVTDGFTITNTHTPATISIDGTKVWKDDSNNDGKRPASITVYLLKNGEVINTQTQVVSGSMSKNKWTFEWTDLPKYEDGKEITYTVSEEPIMEDGSTLYSTEITGNAKDGFTITNKYSPNTINIPVTKIWSDNDNQDGIRPASVTIKLYADGKDTGKTLKLNEDNSWSGSFNELPEYDNGKKIVYTVKETKTKVITGTDGKGTYAYEITASGTGFTVKNTHTPELIEIKGSKVWKDGNNQDGIRPETITVLLQKNGETIKSTETDATKNWKWNFTGLPKYENGTAIVYTVTEELTNEVTGTDGPGTYSFTVKGSADTSFTITNTHTPETTEVHGTKTWNDNDNEFNRRPASITVRLHAAVDGKEITLSGVTVKKTVKPNAKGKWEWTWSGLPKYQNGTEIVYTITENTVKYYDTEVYGYDLINTYNHTPLPATYTLNVLKDVKAAKGVVPTKQKFYFNVEAVNDAPAFEKSRISVTGAGYASFGTATFSEPGTYTYLVTEEDYTGQPGYENITFDTTTHTVTITVILGSDGDYKVESVTGITTKTISGKKRKGVLITNYDDSESKLPDTADNSIYNLFNSLLILLGASIVLVLLLKKKLNNRIN